MGEALIILATNLSEQLAGIEVAEVVLILASHRRIPSRSAVPSVNSTNEQVAFLECKNHKIEAYGSLFCLINQALVLAQTLSHR